MPTMEESTAILFNALKPLLPGLPENVSKLTIKLGHGKPPMVECEYWTLAKEGGEIVSGESTIGKFALVAIGGTLPVDMSFSGLTVEHKADQKEAI